MNQVETYTTTPLKFMNMIYDNAVLCICTHTLLLAQQAKQSTPIIIFHPENIPPVSD